MDTRKKDNEFDLDDYMLYTDSKSWVNNTEIWYSPHSNATKNDISVASNRILYHQKATLQGEQQIIHLLKNMNENINELNGDIKKIKRRQAKQKIKLHTPPHCLLSFEKKSDSISKIKVESIIAELQYHLGLLTTPGTTEELIPFKENDLSRIREQSYTVESLKKFIAADNNGHALVVLRTNEGAKNCLCQLAVHKSIGKTERKRCKDLLSRCEAMSPIEEYVTNLHLKQLSTLEELLFEQRKIHSQQLQQLADQNKTQELEIKKLQQQMEQLLLTQENLNQTTNTITNASLQVSTPSLHEEVISNQRHTFFNQNNNETKSFDLSPTSQEKGVRC